MQRMRTVLAVAVAGAIGALARWGINDRLVTTERVHVVIYRGSEPSE